MRINVRLFEQAARSVRGLEAPSAASSEVLAALDELGAALEPVHPGVTEPFLMADFFVEVPDAESADRVISRLLECEAVDGAYLKPPDELP